MGIVIHRASSATAPVRAERERKHCSANSHAAKSVAQKLATCKIRSVASTRK